MKRTITKESYGEWAVITGASSGVGREMALEIASKGISVVLVATRVTPRFLNTKIFSFVVKSLSK